MVAFCSKPWKLEAIFEMWKEPRKDGPGCLGDPSASGMTGTIAVVAWLTEERIEREIWRTLATPLSISSQLGHCLDAIMVQCWVWLVGIVWQLVWKTTWQMEWKCRGRLVLRDVQKNGPSERWHESVELECGWRYVRVAGF